MKDLNTAFNELPLVAILRGLSTDQAVAVGGALVDAGFRIIEVPLNSPDPLRCISVLAEEFGDQALIGAGTVLSADDIRAVVDAGGRLIVSPHFDPGVIGASKAHEVASIPGVATPTEAFAALAAGADALKLFPGEMLPPKAVKAWRAVLPGEDPPVAGRRDRSGVDGRLYRRWRQRIWPRFGVVQTGHGGGGHCRQRARVHQSLESNRLVILQLDCLPIGVFLGHFVARESP